MTEADPLLRILNNIRSAHHELEDHVRIALRTHIGLQQARTLALQLLQSAEQVLRFNQYILDCVSNI